MIKIKKVSCSTLMVIWKAPLYPNTGATAQKFANMAMVHNAATATVNGAAMPPQVNLSDLGGPWCQLMLGLADDSFQVLVIYFCHFQAIVRGEWP